MPVMPLNRPASQDATTQSQSSSIDQATQGLEQSANALTSSTDGTTTQGQQGQGQGQQGQGQGQGRVKGKAKVRAKVKGRGRVKGEVVTLALVDKITMAANLARTNRSSCQGRLAPAPARRAIMAPMASCKTAVPSPIHRSSRNTPNWRTMLLITAPFHPI